MKNPLTILRYFFIYKRQIKKNKKYLETNYGLNIDSIYRLWTVIDLSSVPEEVEKKTGLDAVIETELKKYIYKFNKDLGFLELNDLINVYEIKKINDYMYGVTFGYSLYNNLLLFMWALGIVIASITTALFFIL